MTLLRKLAEMVVEFPDPPKLADEPEAEKQGDVLAAIEQARKDVEGAVLGSFDAGAANSPGSAGTDGVPSEGIQMPAVLSIAEVYARAKVESGQKSMGVDKVEGMLADPEMADLAPEIRARMVKLALKNMGHELHEVILDAARRDKALDQYGEWLESKVQDCARQVDAANAKLEKEIAEFTAKRKAQMETNSRIAAQSNADLQAYLKLKDIEEERLFRVVAPFVAPGENPVVLDNSAKVAGQEHQSK